MRISEYIYELQELLDIEGDLEIVRSDDPLERTTKRGPMLLPAATLETELDEGENSFRMVPPRVLI